MQDELCQVVTSDSEVTRRTLPTGAFLSASPTDTFFVIIEGAVSVELHEEDRPSPTTLEVLVPGDCVPHWPMTRTPGVPYALRAMMPSVVAGVPLRNFDRIVQATPSFAGLLGARFARQHASVIDRFAEATLCPSLRRVSAAVDYLGRKLGRECPLAPGTRIPLPQSEIAQVANYTRQTTNDVLMRLQEAGLIQVERAMVCVRDRASLSAVAHGAPLELRWEPATSCQLAHPDDELTCYPLRRAPAPRADTRR